MIKEYPLNSRSLMVKRMEFSKSSSVAALKDQVTGGKDEGVFILYILACSNNENR